MLVHGTDLRRRLAQVAPGAAGADARAPRLDTLAGKRIGFAWDYLFRGEELFPVLAAELQRRFEGVEIVDYDMFGNLHGPHEHELVAALPDVLAAPPGRRGRVGQRLLRQLHARRVAGIRCC